MKTRWLGLATMAVGLGMSVAGAAGLVFAGSADPEPVAAPSTTVAQTSTSTSAVPSTTTTTTAATSTTSEPASTTTTTATTTTTIAVADLVEAFVTEFTGWIASGDTETLVARLHPVVIEEYGADLCRGFVEREILELENYRLSGPVTGPNPSSYGSVDVDLYEAPATFTFQGSEFTGNAGFALVDGVVHWFATCR